MSSLCQDLLDANPKNTWAGVFDVSSVRGGSFRMPFCGKMSTNAGLNTHHGLRDSKCMGEPCCGDVYASMEHMVTCQTWNG